MADILLNKVINEDISSNLLIKWLLKPVSEYDDDFKANFDSNVGQIDFVTYFLNFIHEEVPCSNKLPETPQKLKTPKQFDNQQINNANVSRKALKHNLFPTQPSVPENQNSSSEINIDNLVGNFSTPKVNKTPGSRNDNYCSPISPLYQSPIQNNYSVKEANPSNESKKSGDKYSICLGDFLVARSKSASKKKRHSLELTRSRNEVPRRIKPTNISLKQANSFQNTENSYNFQEDINEISVNTVTEQRSLLAEERTKLLSRKDDINSVSCPVILKRHNSLSKSDIKPVLSLVTFKNNISHIVNIYKTILDYKLVLNITSEIYFLISLFLTKQSERSHQNSKSRLHSENEEDSNLGVDILDSSCSSSKPIEDIKSLSKSRLYNSEIFGSIHNVVYFAAKCLETQINVIQLYDKITIRLLAENERMQAFSPLLSKKLLAYMEKSSNMPCADLLTPVSQRNVYFDIETDNNKNFPDHISFHAFRKQRDLFYEILRIWETQHLITDWDFSLGLRGKIRTLFSFHDGPTNYMHLARLFKNQLLSSCAKGPKEKGLLESSVSFLPPIAIDADKLNRLTNRLVTKQTSNGINALPVFSGYQEFFKEFLVVSADHFFMKHLSDIFITDIIELNDTNFAGTELEDDGEGDEVDLNTRKLYANCLRNLRILAKFLGFIESLPYNSGVSPSLPKNVLEAHIKARQQFTPPLNIKSLLESSIQKRAVVLIIPWLSKYLAMLDYVTLRLPYYVSVHSMLYHLYRNYEESETSLSNAAVVRFCLGWLFELPHFPDIDYYSFCSKRINFVDLTNHNGISSIKVGSKSRCLDEMDIVNQSILYLCCPYLEEIKKLLSTNASGSKIAVKYITPLTSVETNSEVAKKKLEQQLEEAFFSGQPTSLRKTVEFVSERVASTAVKYICHDLVPKAKEIAITDLRETLFKSDVDDQYCDVNERKAALRKQATALAKTHLTKFLQTCDEEVQKLSHDKIPPSVESLLPVGALEGTIKVCIGVTNKMYMERVKQWLNNHVNLTLFAKDFDQEIHKEACCRVIENDDITSEYVLNVMQGTHKSLTQRNDINDLIAATISVTTFDFCLLLGYPSLFTSSNNMLVTRFMNIWTFQPKVNSMFKSFFCPRNVKMLQGARKKVQAWDLYAEIISCVLDKKLVELDELESQCTGFYNRDWDQEILNNFSYFLKKLVNCCSCKGPDNQFAYLLDFLSDFCSDL